MDSLNDKNKTARFPYLVLAVSIFLTVGVTYNFYQSAKNKDSIRFTNEVNRIQASIENKINLYIALLKGGRGFVESNREITRRGFADYVESLDLEKNYSGVLGIGYAKVIAANEREAFVKKMKAEGFMDFNIFPAAEKKSYTVVAYLEPMNKANRKVVGLDLSAETNRLAALDSAEDSGNAACSSKINLAQNDASGAASGFMIYLPIYKNEQTLADVEDRRKNLAGYIYSPFRAADFLNEIQNDKTASDVELKIYDGEASAENLLAQSAAEQNTDSAIQIDKPYTAQTKLNVAGRSWTVAYFSLPSFAAQSSLGWTPLIFIIGAVGSFLLFGMTYWETSARLKLQTAAAELMEAEKQKQALLEKEQKARLSAEQANKTKDEFIAVVSHELRTPLNAIAGWTKILRTDDLSANTKNLALEKIDKNLRSQKKLVEELLDYSQIVSGTANFEGKPIDFSGVFENTFSEVESKAHEKSVEFLKNNQLNGHLILGDKDKLRIAIYNVLTNAVKFTDSGGRVETILTETGGAIRMIVKDSGIGINPEFLPHVFERFAQADASSTRNSGGFGLGLTISNQIIKLHNGTIEAASKGIGKGATFTVIVPHL
ncbi:MAG: CHASE domain-containing protein [Pyrinomonadaceae bacterium]